MNKITISKVELADLSQLQSISMQTFTEAFADKNTEENMRKYLNESFSMDQLRNELKNKNSEFYFATIDNRVIGYLKINFGNAQTELKDQQAIEIERIYVLKDHYGKNIGQTLFNAALQRARQINSNYLWLGVWEENPRAINFYRKNGFVEFDKHTFKLGDEEQKDVMMKLNLV